MATTAPSRRRRGHALVDRLLLPMIAGDHPVDRAASAIVHDADAYSAAPGELADAYAPAPGAVPVWYFLSPAHYHDGDRRCRRVACAAGGAWSTGFWATQRASSKHEEPGGAAVRHVRGYFFMDKTAETTTRRPTGWVMVEYGIVPNDGGQEQLVLCEMYRLTRDRARAPPYY